MAIDLTRVKRTRGGHKVRIYATDGDETYPIHGAIFRDHGWLLLTWDIHGAVLSGRVSDSDLIEEPRTIEIESWLNVYRDGSLSEWQSREGADLAALTNRFACIHFKRTVTEGEGL